MGNDDQYGLVVDPEFSSLIAPLSKSEYEYLEASILSEGCREPIVVWGSTIIDGHNRYKICKQWGLHFRIRQMEFNDRQEAISWICAVQLGRRNISDETRKYLIGKRFDAEKAIRRKKVKSAAAFKKPSENPPQDDSELDQSVRVYAKNPTAERIAAEHHLAHSTVEKYATYSRALDMIGHKVPPMLPKILSGKYKISHENIILLARLDTASMQRLETRLMEKQDSTAFVPFCISREEINACFVETTTPEIHTGIKVMPAFDPDAEVNGLSLTVPTWARFISQIRGRVDFEIISPDARGRLESVLEELSESIRAILQMLRGDR